MAFLDNNDLLVLEKNDGKVRIISNGTLLEDPILDLDVENASERGLLGVAISDDKKDVFLYITESASGDIRNRVYRYHWQEASLSDGVMILDLPGTPGPNHDGGKVKLGPDGMLYVVIGDLNRNGMLQNFRSGSLPDDTSVILRVDRDGNPTPSVFSSSDADVDARLAGYYAYGIRNSFGLTFDPVTQLLWDTENGPSDYDEVNMVMPGFNSGWEQLMGPEARNQRDANQLLYFDGSRYRDPVFSWRDAVGLTDIEFLRSSILGDAYKNTIFVGDFNNGILYHFVLTPDRKSLDLEGKQGLSDLVADNSAEVAAVTFGTGFGGITDIETGPDDYLYILSYNGSVYRIVPAQ
jgi:glucose/arabinose dehydrogenase